MSKLSKSAQTKSTLKLSKVIAIHISIPSLIAKTLNPIEVQQNKKITLSLFAETITQKN
jgi:hypothetical protein